MARISMVRRLGILAASVAMGALPGSAQAHRQWMLPSATVLSGDDIWVTVDAAVSNDLFYFEHVALPLDNVTAIAPDGTEAKIENPGKGRYRSTFDVHLTQKGTYKIGSASVGVMGSYTLNGEQKRLPRGLTKDKVAAAIPAGATDVRVTEASNRNEIFVTVGAPTDTVFKPTGEGIELVPVTHPNDLLAGEEAVFQFLLDGQPAVGLTVTVIPGGIRYRDVLGQMDFKTGTDGKVKVTWPTPGMYWMNVSTGGGREGGPGEPGKAAPAPGSKGPGLVPKGGDLDMPPATGRRASYVTTLEVLAP